MDDTERKRAGAVVAARMAELGLTPATTARRAGLDPTTVRAFIRGDRWPQTRTRTRINEALGWPPGEVARRAIDGGPLERVSTVELARTLYERVQAGV